MKDYSKEMFIEAYRKYVVPEYANEVQRAEYGKADTTEHDKVIRADERAKVIAEIEKGMHEAYKGTSHTWDSMVFDLVIEQIKEQKND